MKSLQFSACRVINWLVLAYAVLASFNRVLEETTITICSEKGYLPMIFNWRGIIPCNLWTFGQSGWTNQDILKFKMKTSYFHPSVLENHQQQVRSKEFAKKRSRSLCAPNPKFDFGPKASIMKSCLGLTTVQVRNAFDWYWLVVIAQCSYARSSQL